MHPGLPDFPWDIMRGQEGDSHHSDPGILLVGTWVEGDTIGKRK